MGFKNISRLCSSRTCQHKKQFNCNGKLISMTVVTNCIKCLQQQFVYLSYHPVIQISNINIIELDKWVRKPNNNRLHREREIYKMNGNCKSLGFECHQKYTRKQTNPTISSFACFQYYNGKDTDRIYQKKISNRYRLLRRNLYRAVKHFSPIQEGCGNLIV